MIASGQADARLRQPIKVEETMIGGEQL